MMKLMAFSKKDEVAPDEEFTSGERLYLGVNCAEHDSPQDHFDRYQFARAYLKPGFTVVDAACGSGYGSEMLASACKEVVGVEISDHALAWAKEHYEKNNISFVKGDLNKPLPLPSSFADAVVSFETLEHVQNQNTMLSEFARVLKPDGLLVISSPDKEVINGPGKTDSGNQFHIHELSKKEMIDLLEKHFIIDELYGQNKFYQYGTALGTIAAFVKAIDVLNLRRFFLRRINETKADLGMHPFSPIQKIRRDIPSHNTVIIAVCRKRPGR